jgi:valyl-tRNA synthetase
MEKTYNPSLYENKIYSLWEKSCSFTPKINKNKKAFSIILPPPNANADLHLGHAMFVIEDILVRYHRMKGNPTLWLPGTDHAGFETQYVYEKYLAKQGKSRLAVPRKKLYKDIWDFVQKNKSNMISQLKAMGFSLDWSREKFTLDPQIIKIVYQTFKKLYDDGLVYRSQRLVNYCTSCGTAFSDLEINHLEVKAKLWFIKYPFKNSSDFITIATTRPETLLGDTAVAVHPNDKRYQKQIGKKVLLPIVNREIPIVADSTIEIKFGTGAVKVTPAHDENDWQIAQRHNLEKIQVIDFNGKIKQTKYQDIPKDLIGLPVALARKMVLEKLSNLKLLEKQVNHKMVLAKCYKCQNTLQPLPLPQWFIKVKPLTIPAIKAVKTGKIKIIPKRFEKIYYQWLKNLYDWNISRQCVWGIRIPAWQCLDCQNQQSNWIITDGSKPDKCPKCGSAKLEQDPDTFDTWFSSAQWPYATLQTAKPGDFDYFYPTSVLDTMWDILPFWVIRMVMLGIYSTGKIPFKVVYLHSRVTDEKGQKMSKSKGNVINPMEMITKYGADALRLSLVFGTSPGTDLRMSEDKIRGFRNFTNKLWNIGRFITLQQNAIPNPPEFTPKLKGLKPEDFNLIKLLNLLIKKTTNNLDNYRFSDASQDLYQFIWHKLADIYLEKIKDRLKNKDKSALSVLNYSFLTCLKLLHPFMPFITEVLWQQLSKKKEELLITSKWPKLVFNNN